MKNLIEHRLFGITFYLLAMLSLQQVVTIPLVALLLILTIYKAPSALAKSHARYVLAVYAGISLVMLLVTHFFAQEERIVAALFAVAVSFIMLAFGAYRHFCKKAPFSAVAQ